MPELVLALDFDNVDDALHLAEKTQNIIPWVKVGLELFSRGGPVVLSPLKQWGYKVFLDLKLHDIPNTVRGAVLACAAAGADMLTLHMAGGERMCREARNAVRDLPNRPLLFGVTVLTSLGDGDIPGCALSTADATRLLAGRADDWGLDGVVCSGHEAADVKRIHPRLLCLTPGIRPGGGSADDQRRIMTPAQAVSAGSDFLVVGRPISQAADPLQAARAIAADMELGKKNNGERRPGAVSPVQP